MEQIIIGKKGYQKINDKEIRNGIKVNNQRERKEIIKEEKINEDILLSDKKINKGIMTKKNKSLQETNSFKTNEINIYSLNNYNSHKDNGIIEENRFGNLHLQQRNIQKGIDHNKNNHSEIKNELKINSYLKEKIKIKYGEKKVNKRNDTYKFNINNNKYTNFNIYINFIIINLFIQALSINELYFFLLTFSKITLKIKGIGYKNIFGCLENYAFNNKSYPNEIYIDGNKQDIITHSYEFNKTDNFVELIWNKNINNTWNMFRLSYNITEFDFSNFDTSEITNMGGMFWGCSSLTSLNLSSFNTSKVIYMHNMFTQCSSLTSLDLSNFDTSNVFRLNSMFSNCINLEYINFKKFNETNLSDNNDNYKNIFYQTPDNIVICINKDNNISKIFSQIKDKKCSTIDCSNDWYSKQKK